MIASVDTVLVEIAGHSAWAEPATWIGIIGVIAGPFVAWLIGRQQITVGKAQIASQLTAAEQQVNASRETAKQQVEAQLAAAREQIAADLQISERQFAASVRSTARLKWIDDLRAAVAELTSTATILNVLLWRWKSTGTFDQSADDPQIASLTQRFAERRQAIRMWLNLDKPEQGALDDAVNRLNAILGDPSPIEPARWTAALQDVIERAKLVFELHWERAKRGE